MLDLRGQVAVVTGGSRGIGRAIALRFAQMGAKTAICARQPGPLQNTEAQMKLSTRHVLARTVDVTDAQAIQHFVDIIVAKWGRIDILVNNAGVLRSGKVQDLPLEDWDWQFQVNMKGPFLFTKAVLPHMKKQQAGRLIYISSTAALISPPGNACYAATKWGLDGLVGSFARELCDDNIKCHTIRPGYVNTSLFDIPGRPDNPAIDWIEPDEIANSVEFLCGLPAHAQVPDLNYTTTYQRKKF